jgi:hypothetical protein
MILTTLKGYTVYEYEQSFIFTAPISPIYFLISGLLSDLTIFSFFFYPVFLFLGIVSVSLNLATVQVLSIVMSTLFFAFFLVFLKSSLSILQSVYHKTRVKLVSVALIAFLLFPAIGLFTQLPIRYGGLPYPSTILAQSLLAFLSNGVPSTTTLLGSAAYFLGAMLLFLFTSRKNLFQFANPVPLVSPFDSSMRVQTLKMEKNVKFFSKTGFGISLNLKSESLLRFLMKKEMIRMIRDGSLFTVFLFYFIVGFMSLAGGTSGASGQSWLFTLAIYSFIIPSMLLSNWRITEHPNLWMPLTSGLNFGYIIKPLLYDLALIAFAVPAAAIVLLTLITQINPLVPLVLIVSVAMIGCSANLYVVMLFLGRKQKATPSLMIMWVSMLLSGLLMAPTYIFVALTALLRLSAEINVVLSAVIIAYSAAVFKYLSRTMEKKTKIIEI